MGKFKVGDRVRFKDIGHYGRQKIGDEATVIRLDSDGYAIVDTDPADDQIGWTDRVLEVIGTATSPEITLRDQLAMAALTGLLASGGRVDDETIREAYLAANLMLAERERAK